MGGKRTSVVKRIAWCFAAAALTALAYACGSSGSSVTTPSPSGCSNNPNTSTIVISGGSVCPQRITVARGTQVTFVNQDSTAHEMNSDPHPEHTDCPEINQVGHLEPGQSRQTGNLNVVRQCGFHDHLHFESAQMKGVITIQ